jgi:hypothetical protein
MSDVPTSAAPVQAPNTAPAANTTAAPDTAASANPSQAPDTAPAADSGPSPAELRRQLLNEKLEQLRAAKARQAQRADYEAAKKAAQQEAERARSETERWKKASSNPMDLLKELGVAPEQMYQTLTDHLLDQQTPESHQRRLYEFIRQEINKSAPQVDELKTALEAQKQEIERFKQMEAERQQRVFMAEKTAREAEMLKTIKSREFEELQDFYSDEQLIAAAYQIAEHRHQQGKSYAYEEVAKDMLAIHNSWYQNVNSRLAAKKAQSTPNPQSSPLASEKAPESPTAIGNDVASAVASGDKPRKTRKEAAAERAKAIAQLLKE